MSFKNLLIICILQLGIFSIAQQVHVQTLLNDKISIRAMQISDDRVYYVGTDSKFGYVNLKDSADRKQFRLSNKKLQFRTLAQTDDYFYTVSIESPAYFFKINKKTLEATQFFLDEKKTAFYDAWLFDAHQRGIAISDPNDAGEPNFLLFPKNENDFTQDLGNFLPRYFPGEAHFAASNSNIAMHGQHIWIATGGGHARIFKFSWSNPYQWQIIETPFIQGASSQGIYSIDFYNNKLGIAVGGDYTKQDENINNIATTKDGGKTWQIQASGKNGGYKTCVKFRPGSRGKYLIAVGDQNIEISSDFGETWTIISQEKELYIVDWINENTVVLAGKNRIIKMTLP